MTGDRMWRPDGEPIRAWGGSAARATPAGAGPVTWRPRAEGRRCWRRRRCGSAPWRRRKQLLLQGLGKAGRSFAFCLPQSVVYQALSASTFWCLMSTEK
ncbi:hypothetical protein VULLAG_LOCUS10300 [Vulpes lagopus]